MVLVTEVALTYDFTEEGYCHPFSSKQYPRRRFCWLSQLFIFDGRVRGIAQKDNALFVVIDKTGQELSPEYEGIYYLACENATCNKDLLFAHRDDVWWLLNVLGEKVREAIREDFPENSPLAALYHKSIAARTSAPANYSQEERVRRAVHLAEGLQRQKLLKKGIDIPSLDFFTFTIYVNGTEFRNCLDTLSKSKEKFGGIWQRKDGEFSITICKDGVWIIWEFSHATWRMQTFLHELPNIYARHYSKVMFEVHTKNIVKAAVNSCEGAYEQMQRMDFTF